MAETSGIFTLTITGNKTDGYKIGAIAPDIQVESHSFPSRTTLLTEVEENILSRLVDGSAEEREIQQLGKKLYQAVFGHPSIQRAFDEARGWARAKGCFLRLWLEIQPPELAALPWETMYDGHDWLSTRAKVPLARRLPDTETGGDRQTLATSGPLKILFVGDSPDGLDRLDIRKIGKVLETTLHDSIQAGKVKLDILYNATLEELQQALVKREHRSDQGYHILLFSGHGSPNGIYLDDGQGDVVIEVGRVVGRERGEPEMVSAKTLAEALEPQDIRLVFLMACNTSTDPNPTDDLLEGVAQTLVKQTRVPAVVAMQYAFGVENAGTLGGHFFNALAGFQAVDVALTTARPTLKDGEEQVNRDVFNPVLYLQAEDAALFKPKKNWSAIILSVALVLSLLAGGVIFLYGQDQTQKRLTAEATATAENFISTSRKLAAHSLANLDTASDLSLLLSAEAYQFADTPDARNSLLVALQKHAQLIRIMYYGDDQSVKSVALSPTGQTLALGGCAEARKDGNTCTKGQIVLWDLTNDQPLKPPITAYDNWAESVAFSPNGQILASGSSGNIILWDVNTGAPLCNPCSDDKHSTGYLLFSPNGRMLISSVSLGHSGEITSWRLGDNRLDPVRTFSSNTGKLGTLAFSPDGQILVVGDDYGDIDIYQSGEYVGGDNLEMAGWVTSIAFNSNNDTLAAGFCGGVEWDAQNKCQIMLWHKGDSNEQLAGTFGENERVRRLPLQNTQATSLLFIPVTKTGTPNDLLISGNQDGSIIGWDIDVGEVTKSKRLFTLPLGVHKEMIKELIFNANPPPNQTLLTSLSTDGRVALWQIRSDHPPLSLDSGSYESINKEWHNLTGHTLDTPTDKHNNEVDASWQCSLYNGNGEIEWCEVGEVILLDKTSRQEIGRLTGFKGELTTELIFSPDGQSLAFGSIDGIITLLRENDGIWSFDNSIRAHNHSVTSLAFSPNGQILASGSCTENDEVSYQCVQGEFRLWNSVTGNPIGQPFIAHNANITDLVFSPDGKFLVSRANEDDKTVLLWDFDVKSWQKRACHIANRDLTKVEWKQYIGDAPYRETCSDLLAGK